MNIIFEFVNKKNKLIKKIYITKRTTLQDFEV